MKGSKDSDFSLVSTKRLRKILCSCGWGRGLDDDLSWKGI